MLVDETRIKVQAGKGGDGAATFFPGYKTGPSGGDGGRGGSIYVKGNVNLGDLRRYANKPTFKAEAGGRGGNFRKEGKNGQDIILEMPLGTTIIDIETGAEIEITDDETHYPLARGGRGGRGNAYFTSSTNQSPMESEPGRPGQTKQYKLVLKLIADIGFIGLPNAGKSSLLNELTAAKVKTAMYAFTTLEPNLGVFERKILADIPGLIEGASEGKGLGHKFLKHIEKVHVLFHCISAESDDLQRDYDVINKELENYNPKLMEKKQIILLTKTDLLNQKETESKVKKLKKLREEVYPVSIYNPDQFVQLQELIKKI